MCIGVPAITTYAQFQVLAKGYQKLLIYSFCEHSENLELTSPGLLKKKPLTQRSPRQMHEVFRLFLRCCLLPFSPETDFLGHN